MRQRVLRHVGTATSAAQLEQLEQLEQLAHVVLEELTREASPQTSLFSVKEVADLLHQARRARPTGEPLGIDLADCREESRVAIGVREAFGAVYTHVGWDRLLGARRQSANRIIKELVLARIAQPRSKRATVRELDHHGALSLNLDSVYRSMDRIDEARIQGICRRSREVMEALLPGPLTVVFYDTTTLYFEREQDDELRRKGYSKDGKPHRVQVLFALLATPQGLPVGYELFPGDRYEGHTLITALEALERHHEGVRFTIVADAGMINKAHEEALQRRGTSYMLGARLKTLPAAQQRAILAREGYRTWPSQESSEAMGRFRRLPDGKRTRLVTWSPRRARKDAHERTRRIGKLQTRLSKHRGAASYSHHGVAQFLDFPDGYPDGQVALNEDKIAQAARWDGLRGIITWGCDQTDPSELIAQYRRLSEIEACFRTNKHDLSIRPIFHWKPRRVQAHIAICYMAFCCLQHLRYRLEVQQGQRMSPDRIRRALNALQISMLYDTNSSRRFGLPSAASTDARAIYRMLGLHWHRVRRSPTRHRGSRDRPKRSCLSRFPAHLMGDSIQHL